MLDVCKLLNIVKQDEFDAPNMYEKLRKALNNKVDNETIKRIISDEKRHYEEVSNMMTHIHCK